MEIKSKLKKIKMTKPKKLKLVSQKKIKRENIQTLVQQKKMLKLLNLKRKKRKRKKKRRSDFHENMKKFLIKKSSFS
jgi:hypothetical protein